MHHFLVVLLEDPRTEAEKVGAVLEGEYVGIEERVSEALRRFDYNEPVDGYEDDCHECDSGKDPECKVCNGTGAYTSTSNPDGRFDWYEIGGRWNGDIRGKKVALAEPTLQALSSGMVARGSVSDNWLPVSSLPKDLECAAILTPAGEWIENGSWNHSDEDVRRSMSLAWFEEQKEVFEKYRNCLAVGVDYHS